MKAGRSTCKQKRDLTAQVAEQMKPCRARQIKWICVMTKKHYFRSSINKVASKRASKVLTNKIHNKFSDVFQAKAALNEPLEDRSRQQPYQVPPRRVTHTF